VSAPRRNVELKAIDTDPERSLAVCRELGASDEGLLVQRDTYFRTPSGRLKLREEQPGGATLVQYDRPDDARARLSAYRLVPVVDADGLRTALDAALGTLVVVDKERHLFLWNGVRIHLDRVRDLGTFVEIEAVAPPESDLEPERAKVARLQDALGIGPDRILADSYSDRLLAAADEGRTAPGADAGRTAPGVDAGRTAPGADEAAAPDDLVAAARAVMERAYAPYSRYHVGAALRAGDGSIHVGANVENSAYPQGQCAEASAIGALVAAGQTRVTEVAVVAGADEVCVPCGGCRQRLREFMPLDGIVHLCGASGAHVAATLEELLPRSFGPEYLP
jgi:homotetrameric cytidine deaminase